MMVNPISKKHSLGIDKKSFIFLTCFVTGIVIQYSFYCFSYFHIESEILIPKNVPSRKSCLRQIVDKFFLFGSDRFESRKFIPEYPYILKLVYKIIKIVTN